MAEQDNEDLPETEAAGTATADDEEEDEYQLTLTVDVTDAGPCRKHVRVHVPQADISHFREEAVAELTQTAAVPGFRTGHVPRALIEKRFRKELSGHVKQQVLVRSLDQVSQEHELDAINEPDLDVESLEIPESGDFDYEFNVEVRPHFDLPNYSGVKIQRPVREISEAEVDKTLTKYLEQFAVLSPLDEPAAAGDCVLTTLHARCGDQDLCHKERQQIRIRPVLRFQDAEVAGFDKLMVGVKPGESRSVETKISMEADKLELRGEPVRLTFDVTDVLRLKLPELNADFLKDIGLDTPEQLREEVRKTLDRQLELEQRQAARRQVLERITDSAEWDLPESLVRRQVENARRRDWLEMHQAGFTDEQIRAREGEMMQQRVSATRQALKEHFVLDKIATEEKLQVTPENIDQHIRYMAFQRGENPRKVRARLEKQGMMDNLTAQILEELAIQLVVSKAQFEDVPTPAPEEQDAEALDFSLCGVTPEAPSKFTETTE